MDPVGLHVCASLADAAVAAGPFAAVDLVQPAVHADQEHVQPIEQAGQLSAPGAVLDDVLDDQVVAGRRESRQAPVKAGEEPRAHRGLPRERPVGVAAGRQHPAGHELV